MQDYSANLTPGPPEAAVMSVSMLNHSVARLLEKQVPLCWISGEVSNFTRASSGHWYFTLKDDAAQVRAVMFRGRAQYASFTPREGDRIEVRAQVTLYAPRGDYQLNVEAVRRAGVGNLYEAFIRLKEKLAAQGLFDPAKKRPLPSFPRRIGIITSPQAAALRDVLIALQRRCPHVELILYPVPVQGNGAAEKIAQMLQLAGQRAECDLLILCRGGGSIEDLWCFNEEMLALAIAACPLPIIAGIGHETDFTIADFVADLRAPTPTAAAELACQASTYWQTSITQQARELQRAMQRLLETRQQQLDLLARRLPSPDALVQRQQLRLQHLQTRLQHAWQQQQDRSQHRLRQAHTRLQLSLPDTRPKRRHLQHLAQSLQQTMQYRQRHIKHQLNHLQAQLELLNPQRTLERGYAIASLADGRILRAPQDLAAASQLHLRLAQGEAVLEVNNVLLPTEKGA